MTAKQTIKMLKRLVDDHGDCDVVLIGEDSYPANIKLDWYGPNDYYKQPRIIISLAD